MNSPKLQKQYQKPISIPKQQAKKYINTYFPIESSFI